MNKSEILDKSIDHICYKCKGTGIIKRHRYIQQCPLCLNTGVWKERFYIIIDNKNKIAIDSDTGS